MQSGRKQEVDTCVIWYATKELLFKPDQFYCTRGKILSNPLICIVNEDERFPRTEIGNLYYLFSRSYLILIFARKCAGKHYYLRSFDTSFLEAVCSVL